jgi:hypothetical protein
MKTTIGGAMMKIAIVGTLSLPSLACQLFVPPQEHPVLDDRVTGETGKPSYVQFATTPERRVVLMNVDNNRVCAEPSPDAAENISYNLSAALSAKQKSGDQADASVATALQSAAHSLFTRTQGVQFYRDGMFSLCLAYMNGEIEGSDYKTLSSELRGQAFELIKEEIPYIAGITKQKKAKPDAPSKAPSDQSDTATATTPATSAPADGTFAPLSPKAPLAPAPLPGLAKPSAPAQISLEQGSSG